VTEHLHLQLLGHGRGRWWAPSGCYHQVVLLDADDVDRVWGWGDDGECDEEYDDGRDGERDVHYGEHGEHDDDGDDVQAPAAARTAAGLCRGLAAASSETCICPQVQRRC